VPVFSFDKAWNDLQQGKIPLFVLLHGDEQFLARKFVRMMRQVLQGVWGEVEYVEWDQEAQLADIYTSLETVPLGVGGRLVVVNSPADLKPYLRNKNSHVAAIFLFEKKLKKSDKSLQLVAERGWVVECLPLKGKALEKWIQAEARARKKELPASAVKYLRFLCGDNLALASQELEKACLFMGPQEPRIDVAALQAVGSRSTERSIFEFVDAVAGRKGAAAQEILSDLLAQGEPPVLLISLLSRHFLQLLEAGCLLAEGVSGGELGKVMGIHPYVGKKLQEQSRFFTIPETERILDSLLELDHAVKKGKGSPVLLIESLLGEICR
jgi:DNA polymerase-3 subunit delta